MQEQSGGMVTANLLMGLGIDEFFMRTDGIGTSALLPDALGSTVALGDGTGTLQTQYTYEPFGAVSQAGQASSNSYKYTGREDDGSGLYYYRARYYHPRLQRFIAEDPLGFQAGDMNFYAYTLNNPIKWSDPVGLFSKDGSPGVLRDTIKIVRGDYDPTIRLLCFTVQGPPGKPIEVTVSPGIAVAKPDGGNTIPPFSVAPITNVYNVPMSGRIKVTFNITNMLAYIQVRVQGDPEPFTLTSTVGPSGSFPPCRPEKGKGCNIDPASYGGPGSQGYTGAP